MSLSHRAIQASIWSALAEICAKGIPPLVFIFLAFLLTPEDFGVVAIATMIISFSQLFWEAGLNKALIQREYNLSIAANVVFWMNIALGTVIYGFLLLLARPLSFLFHDPRVHLAIQVQGFIIILNSLSSVFISLFERAFDFKILFWVRLITALFPGLISIILALIGFEYWSIIFGTIGGACVQCALLWHLSPWRPKLCFDRKIAKELISFGSWVTAEGLLSWVYHWADSMLIGIFLGTHSLGLYRTGHSIINLIYGLLFNSFLPVLYSVFSRMQNNLQRITNIMLRVSRFFSLVAFPIAVLLFMLQSPFLDSVLGQKWNGIGQVIGWLGLMYGLSWTVGVNSTVYRSIGRPDINAKFMCFTMLYYLPAYYFSLQFGIIVFLKTRLIITLTSILLHLWLAKKVLLMEISLFLYNLRVSFFAAAAMSFSLFWVNRVEWINAHLWMQVFFNVLPGLLFYSVFSYSQWPFVKEIAMSLIHNEKEIGSI